MRDDVRGCLAVQEYDSTFKIETDPIFQSLLWHCVKMETALCHLKLNCELLRSLDLYVTHSEDDQTSLKAKKKQLSILPKKIVTSAIALTLFKQPEPLPR